MKLNKLTLVCALAFVTASLSAHADVLITNNTDLYGTGNLAKSPCSAGAGDRGILKPHSSLNVPQFALDLFCGFSCEAHLFASQDCSGKQIATLTIEFNKGVTNVSNLDPEHVSFTRNGNNIIVNPVKKNFLDRFLKWF